MPIFEYQALNAKGRQVKGIVEAEGLRSARQKLKQQGLFPSSITQGKEKGGSKSWNLNIEFRRRKVRASHLAVATRQLATLIGAGMPLVASLKALGEQIDHPGFLRIMGDVTTRVNEGSTLANALRAYPEVFPRLYINMVASGEASGSLELVLERLADLLEAQAALRRRIMSAMTYPVLMLVLCFGVITLLLAYVVPQITTIFQKQHAVLPASTRLVIFLSHVVKGYWWLFLVLAIGSVFGFRAYHRTEKGRRVLDALKLKLPLIGPMSLKIAAGRFSRNLGTMLASGIELLNALYIAKNIMGNALLEDAVEAAANGVREGGSLASQLDKSHLFPRLLIRMIAIGEKTGELEALLLRASKGFESEVNSVIAALTSIMEPFLILFLAVVVGGILAAVMLPMLEMTSLSGL